MLIVLGCIIAFVLLCNYAFPAGKVILQFLVMTLLPFILAMVFTIILKPVVAFMQRYFKLSTGFATFFTVILALCLVVLIILMISSRLAVELTRIAYSLPTLTAHIWDLVESFKSFYASLQPQDIATINDIIAQVSSYISDFSMSTANGILHFLTMTPEIIFLLVVTIIATFFFCRDEEKIVSSLVQLLPKSKREQVMNTYRNFGKVLAAYFRALVILISITTVISLVGLSIIRVDYALTMGLIIGIFDILPVLGPTTIYVPWIVISFLSGNYRLALGLSILYAIVYITRQILEPRIVGGQLGIHPLLTLFSIFVGFRIFGVIGLALGPITVVFLTALYQSRVS